MIWKHEWKFCYSQIPSIHLLIPISGLFYTISRLMPDVFVLGGIIGFSSNFGTIQRWIRTIHIAAKVCFTMEWTLPLAEKRKIYKEVKPSWIKYDECRVNKCCEITVRMLLKSHITWYFYLLESTHHQLFKLISGVLR